MSGVVNYGHLTLYNCTLANNVSSSGYGAILNLGDLNLYNCTLANNHGFTSGAIYNGAFPIQMHNCTVVNNSSGAAFGVGGNGRRWIGRGWHQFFTMTQKRPGGLQVAAAMRMG